MRRFQPRFDALPEEQRCLWPQLKQIPRSFLERNMNIPRLELAARTVSPEGGG
jgi:hypothetical protein